jgi:chromosome segregation ATPase
VSVDLLKTPDISGSARGVLDEFRSTREEFGDFFGDVFDQLQSLAVELSAQQKHLDVGDERRPCNTPPPDYSKQLGRCCEELRQLNEQVQANNAEARQAWAEVFEAQKQSLHEFAEIRELYHEILNVSEEFRGMKQSIDRERGELRQLYATMEDRLTRLAAVSAELADLQSQSIDPFNLSKKRGSTGSS